MPLVLWSPFLPLHFSLVYGHLPAFWSYIQFGMPPCITSITHVSVDVTGPGLYFASYNLEPQFLAYIASPFIVIWAGPLLL